MRHAETSAYLDMPFLRVLFRYLWPFWLLQDVTRGDKVARAAAYRHNRSVRVYLPSYAFKWMINSALALGATAGFDALAAQASTTMPLYWLTALTGILFACSLCITFVIGYIYLYLERQEI